MGKGIINTSGIDQKTLLPSKPAEQAQVRAVDNQPQNAAAISAAKTTNANSKTRSQKAKTKQPETQSTETKTTARKIDRYEYPTDLPVYTMQFLFGPYNRDVSFKDAIIDHDLSITLPLPPNLAESFGLKYNTVSFGPLLNEVLGGVSDVSDQMRGGKEFGKSLSKSITSRIEKAAKNAGEVLGASASRMVGGISETAGAGVDMILGYTPNPSLAVAFQGVGLRTFSYSWKLAPRSHYESQQLINLLTMFKQRSLPQKNQYTLKYPDYVDIILHPSSLNDIIKYKTCVIQDIKINWAPNGLPSFFARSQSPTEVEFSVTLQEVKIFTRDDFSTAPLLKNFDPNGNWWE